MIPTRFLVPRRTQDTTRVNQTFVYRACTFFGWPFNAIQLVFFNPISWSYYPDPKVGLGSSRFARRYSGNRFFFLFLLLLRCFNSQGCLITSYVFTCV